MFSPEDDEQQKLNTHTSMSPPDDGNAGFRGKLKTCGRRCLQNSKENLLLVLLFFGVFFGVGMGFFVRAVASPFTPRQIMYLMFPGEILMRMLKMLILPLIVASLIAGIAGLDAKTCGRMGLRTIAYFATTTFMAVVLGIIMATSIQPGGGTGSSEIKRYGAAKKVNSVDTFLDLIR
ncbi:hypothetical protein SNE40_022332 [Patella caerulea]|uniref:Amino acid transporter n=1 Tax=Patella caerulea TaxID=87958 RepID=A0AAN8GFQ3_PATCE